MFCYTGGGYLLNQPGAWNQEEEEEEAVHGVER